MGNRLAKLNCDRRPYGKSTQRDRRFRTRCRTVQSAITGFDVISWISQKGSSTFAFDAHIYAIGCFLLQYPLRALPFVTKAYKMWHGTTFSCFDEHNTRFTASPRRSPFEIHVHRQSVRKSRRVCTKIETIQARRKDALFLGHTHHAPTARCRECYIQALLSCIFVLHLHVVLPGQGHE